MQKLIQLAQQRTTTLSAAEQARRREAVERAEASARLEGYIPDEVDKILDEFFIEGRITSDEYRAALAESHSRGH